MNVKENSSDFSMQLMRTKQSKVYGFMN